MPRYKLTIEYDGTYYHGWQLQPRGKTVEGEIEKALAQILRQPVDIAGQGRTDSGVHAEGQTAHFDFSEHLDRHKLLFALLGVLPRDIAVWNLEEVAPDFHARFDGTSRQYRYQILTRPSPLLSRTAEMILGDLNYEVMQQCAQMIIGSHNFSGFTKTVEEQPEPTCRVTCSEFEFGEPLIVYRIKANRFVRHMVRRLVGTMIQVGKGKKELEDFADLLHNQGTENMSHGASAKGLILEKVSY